MSEPSEEIARLQKRLGPYIRPRQEVSRIRRVLALHLLQTQQPESDKAEGLWPLALQKLDSHVKSSSSRGLRKDYLKSLRANTKARQEYLATSSEKLDQDDTSTAKKQASHQDLLENPLHNYIFLLQQQKKREKLQIFSSYLDLLDQKPAASPGFLHGESINEGIEPLPPVPSVFLGEEKSNDVGSSVKSVSELEGQLEKAVLQAKFQLGVEKRQNLECKSRLEGRREISHSNVAQRLEALEKTRNEMISWMEDQLGKTGDSSLEDSNETGLQRPKIPMEVQLNNIQKEYRKYVLMREELLSALRARESIGSREGTVGTKKLETSQDISEDTQPTDLIQPFLNELLAISNEQKSQISQRSYLNACLAKQQKESVQSMDRLAEESHLLPAYPMKTVRPTRQTDPLGNEKPDLGIQARRWVFAADAATKATRDAVFQRVEDGRAAVDESLHTLLGLHQLLGYDLEDDGNEGDIWAHESKSPKKGKEVDSTGGSKNDIWSKVDGSLGVLRRDNE